MDKEELVTLKKAFGKNKIIPNKYEEPILTALSHYPELKDIHIEFMLSQKQSVAYRSVPVWSTIWRRPEKRKYKVEILEKAEPPMKLALLKNCPPEAQAGVIGHELAHILQYTRFTQPRLLRFMFRYLFKKTRRRLERGADQAAVFHGLGRELFLHACYIRSIPGYIKQNPSLDTDYLKPTEIMAFLEAAK